MKALLAGLGLLASAVFAGQRVQPYDLGMSLWVPDGWVVERDFGESNYRFYTMYDPTLQDTNLVHSTILQFEVFSGILATDTTTRKWVKNEGLVREYYLLGECYSALLSSDTMLINGRFAREIYGRSASCDSVDFLGPLKDQYIRVTANGDIGWVMSFTGDTADVDTASATYLAILDSIKLDPTFTSIPYVGVRSKFQAKSLRKVVSEGAFLRLNTGREDLPRVDVMDLQGRNLSGRLEPAPGGTWLWRPDSPVTGMVAVRVVSGTSQWMDRAVLRR